MFSSASPLPSRKTTSTSSISENVSPASYAERARVRGLIAMPGIELKRSLFGGGYTVGYECPNCKTRLKSPLDDAGKTDTCPDCKHPFVVPGTQEREQLRWQAEHEEAARKRKALEEQETEAQRRNKQVKDEEARQ